MKKFLAIICSIVFVISICTNILLITTGKIFTKQNIDKVVDSIDFAQIAEEMIESQDFYQNFEQMGLTQEQTEQILNAPIIKETTSTVINNALDYYIHGNENAEIITEEQMDNILKEVIILSEDIPGVTVTPQMEQKIYDYAHPIIKKVQEKMPTVKDIQKQDSKTSDIIHITKIIFGKELKIGLIIVSLFCLLVIYLLRRKEHTYLFWYGTNAASISAILFVIFFLAKLLFSTKILGSTASIIVTMITTFVNSGLLYASVILGISIILFICNHFFRLHFEKKHISKEKASV